MLPKLIKFGDYFLPTYGVLVALAFLAALAVTVRLARRSGLDPERVTNLAVYCALAGLLGAKITMLAFDWRRYAERPSEVFSLSTLMAAGVFQGGLLAALLVAYLYTRHVGLPGLATADAFAPGIALGHAIGRVGCFAAGCCWGTRCDLPWAVTFNNPDAADLTGVPLGAPLHPSQLYEMATETMVFALLYKRYAKPHRPGQMIGLYLLLSSVVRFGIEFTREHAQAPPFGGSLSLTQWIAIPLAAAGVWLMARRGTS